MDGNGKSEQKKRIVAWLRQLPIKGRQSVVVEAKEPGRERDVGAAIYRDLEGRGDNLHSENPFAFQKWYAFDSKENMVRNVLRNLEVGNIVIADRYRASLVYGAQQTEEIAALVLMNQIIMGERFIWPDAVLVFDVSVETAIERLSKKGRTLDGHEKKAVLERVRRNYRFFADAYANCHLIDAEGPPEQIFEEVKGIVWPMSKQKISQHRDLTPQNGVFVWLASACDSCYLLKCSFTIWTKGGRGNGLQGKAS